MLKLRPNSPPYWKQLIFLVNKNNEKTRKMRQLTIRESLSESKDTRNAHNTHTYTQLFYSLEMKQISLPLSLRIPFDFAFDSICKSNKITEKRPSHSSPRAREIVNRIENRSERGVFSFGNENFERRRKKKKKKEREKNWTQTN